MDRIKNKVDQWLQFLFSRYKKSSLFQNAVSAFSINVISIFLAFIVEIILARWLGAKDYGIYIYALTWINLLGLIGQLGFNESAKKYISIYSTGQFSYLKGFLVFSYFSVVLLCLLIVIGILGLRTIIVTHISYVFYLTLLIGSSVLLFNSLAKNTMGVLQGLQKITEALGPHSVLRPLLIIFGAGIASLLLSINGNSMIAMGINAISTFLVLLFLLTLLSKHFPFSFTAIKAEYKQIEWIKVSIPIFLIMSLGFIMRRTDIITIGILLDTKQAGIYAAANRITTVILFSLTAVNEISAPVIAKLYSEGKIKELQNMLTKSARGVIAYSIPAFIAVSLGAKWILYLFGRDFEQGKTSIIILGFGYMLNTVVGTVMFFMTMTDNQNIAAIVMVIVAILNIILNVIFIPIFGIEGAAIATAISTVIWSLTLYLYIKKKLNIDTSPF